MVKRRPWQYSSSAPAPAQDAPGGFGWRGTPRGRCWGHWAPRLCLRCSSEPSCLPPRRPTSPMSPPLTAQVHTRDEIQLAEECGAALFLVNEVCHTGLESGQHSTGSRLTCRVQSKAGPERMRAQGSVD